MEHESERTGGAVTETPGLDRVDRQRIRDMVAEGSPVTGFEQTPHGGDLREHE